jgi:pimeloyl-ACP methyl ester carboxylesterase
VTDLWYEAMGGGPPVVLVHAGICDARMWDEVVAELADEHRVLRYDMRGYGRSGAVTRPFSPSADLVSVLDAEEIERAVVCGVSFGGAVALETAVAHPERVSALLVACCAVDWSDVPEDLTRRIEEADAAAEAGEIARAVELELQIWVDGEGRSTPVDPAVRERVREMNQRALELASQAGAGAEWSEPSVDQRVAEISVPTLVVAGEYDVAFTRQSCRHIAGQIPHARLVALNGVAHLPPLERPGEFAVLLRDLVRRL